MPTDIEPIAGNWYENVQSKKLFQVIAVNEDEGIVAIQNFDGNLDELTLETWYEQDLSLAEPPEDWSGVYDKLEKDDLDYTEV